MIKIPPSLKLVLTFVITFTLTFTSLNFIVNKINEREEAIHNEEALILKQEIKEKFQLALDITLTIGQMSSAFIHHTSKDDKLFEEAITKVIDEKVYIKGVNQLNAKGFIVNAFPKEPNQDALGKVSQNYPALLESYKKGEEFWFSPPIKLFQGWNGFVFYSPITKNGKLLGWIAPVIRSDLFLKHFRSADFFNKYEMVIKDEASGSVYFETGLPPKEGLMEIISPMWGRNIVFQSWPKVSNPKFEIPFYVRFLSALLVSLLFSFFMKVFLQKKKAYMRLEDISNVLKITSNDILSKLIDIQKECLALGSTSATESAKKEIQSAMNLFEQIELLQNIASVDHIGDETFEILPLIREQFDLHSEVAHRKNLKLKLDDESFKEIKVTGNKWLISNTVLKNALSFSTLISCPHGRIEVTHTRTPQECCTIFYIEKIIEEEMTKTFRIDRRLLVAQNVMNLLNGEITIREDGSGGMIVKLTTTAFA